MFLAPLALVELDGGRQFPFLVAILDDILALAPATPWLDALQESLPDGKRDAPGQARQDQGADQEVQGEMPAGDEGPDLRWRGIHQVLYCPL